VNARTASVFPGRSYFKPSGGVEWSSFASWLLVPFAVAAALAGVLFWLFKVGHYYVGIVPALAALVVAACLKLAVNKGNCRSRLVAGAAGICAGVTLYLGYYYCGMVYHLGPETASRLDLLPTYIRFRTHSDVLRDTHESRKNDAPRNGNTLANWGVFGFESVLVLAFTVGGAVGRAKKPYCETCRKWMLRQVTHFEPSKAAELVEAFRNNSARTLALLAAEPVFATVPSTMLAVDFCSSLQEGSARDCACYGSLKNITRAGNNSPVLDRFDSAHGKVLVRSLALSSDEVAALGGRFEVLASVAGRPAVAAFVSQPRADIGSLESNDQPTAQINPVGSDWAGKVLTKRTALAATAWAFAAWLFLFAGLGLLVWGGVTAFPDDKTFVSPETKSLGIAVMAVGAMLFLSTALLFFINPNYLGNRYLLKVVRREFARRTGCVVEPTEPDALFVEIVPKLNWGKMALENASDVGFLFVDKARREILFEGDKERWRIPAAAVLSCDVDYFVEGQGTHGATKLFYVVLRARRPGQFWEAPIRERSGTGMFRSARRKKAAERLCASIQNL